MPKLKNRPPLARLHRPSGLARVRVDGREIYLGPYGSEPARAAYDRLVAAWLANGRALPSGGGGVAAPAAEATPPAPLTVADALLRYRDHCRAYYRGSRELDNIRAALRPLRQLLGGLPLGELRPAHLRHYRDDQVRRGLARRTINARVNQVRRFVKWGVGRDLVEPAVLHRLREVEPLMPGRGGAETGPRTPVPWPAVEATLPHLPAMVRAMALFGWWAGARPGEIVRLATGLIDRHSRPGVWVARLPRHKTACRGKERLLLIGPRAQGVLVPWLLPDRPDEPVFSPRRVDPRQACRGGPRAPGLCYGRSSFGQVIARACRRAGIAAWSPNRLRHAAATRLREAHGLESAQFLLGHSRPDATAIYTSRAFERTIDAIRESG